MEEADSDYTPGRAQRVAGVALRKCPWSTESRAGVAAITGLSSQARPH